jgi:hypothetical protein
MVQHFPFHDEALTERPNLFRARRLVSGQALMVPFLPFLRESSWPQIGWGPSGDRLWFSTIIDEDNGNSYLVDSQDRRP